MAAATRVHVEGTVAYPQSPPSGGDHEACWALWGVHEDVVAPENWVHNLEHGGIVFLYNCPDGCDEDLSSLTLLVNSLPQGRALLTPYAEMETTFAAIAWEHRLLLGCLDGDALQAFYDANVGNAPEDLTSDPPETCGLSGEGM